MARNSIIVRRDQWPVNDRNLWEAGIRPSTILDFGSPADHWRARTIEHYELSYGRWLAWLSETMQLDPEEAPELRVSRDRLNAYIRDLQTLNKPETVFNRVVGLERVLAVVAPCADRKMLRVACSNLPRGGARVKKRAALQETTALIDLGLTLMQRADLEMAPPRPRERAARYRDGLQIALLAMRPLRIKNFTEMELGRHLIKRGGQWWLIYVGEEVKNGRHIEVPVPIELIPFLNRYLEIYRPQLAGSRYKGSRVWVSTYYRAQFRGTIYQKIVWLTQEAFGRALNPHLFRDAMATSLAINNPEIVNVAHAMLGNSLATTERYYNLATSLEAGRHVTATLDSLRGEFQKRGLLEANGVRRSHD